MYGATAAKLDNAMVKALARAFRWRKMLDEGVHGTLGGLGAGTGRARDLCQPCSAAYAARARNRRGNSRWAAAGGGGAK